MASGGPIVLPMIVFIEMPAAGHVNPSLPIVRELTRRGEPMRPERLRAALTRVLDEPGFKDAARTFLPAMGGARQAADEILACRA